MTIQEHRCSLCQQSVEPISYPGVTLSLSRCPTCDLVYNNDRFKITSESVDEFSEGFFENYGQHPLMYETEYRRLLTLVCKGSLQGSTIVDVGCGAGLFLQFLSNRGVNVIGVEANSKLRNSLIQKGILCFSSLEEALNTKKNLIDIVYCSHTLEHFIDPAEALRQMYDLLRPGGGLSVTVPCLNRATFCLERLLRKWEVNYGWGIFYPVHLTYFNRNSLTRMIQSIGFNEIRFLPGVLGENSIRNVVHSEKLVSILYSGIVMPLLTVLSVTSLTPNLALLAKRPKG